MSKQDSATTQNYLDIHDITNDMVILKNGTVSVVVAVDAMNFGLLAEEEQDSIMYAYAGMLNSLNYPIQIVIKSQTKDVTSYLKVLEQKESEATQRVNQHRIRRYRDFVSNLIRERNVLDKKFYIAIPATPLELGILSAQSLLPGTSDFNIDTIEKNIIIEKGLNLLGPKLEHVIGQFARIGLYARQLNTQEIIQLFYANYNPEAIEGQRLADTRQYTTPLVQASIENAPMQNITPSSGVTAPQTPVISTPPSTLAESNSVDSPQVDGVQQPMTPTPPVSQTIPVPPVAPLAQPNPVVTEPTAIPADLVESEALMNVPELTSPSPVDSLQMDDVQQPMAPIMPVSPVAPVAPIAPVQLPVQTENMPYTPSTASGTTPEDELQAQINKQVGSLDNNQI